MIKQIVTNRQCKKDDMTNCIPPQDGSQVPPQTVLPSDSINPDLLSLAMAFVPNQTWETPYNYDVALKRGTVFPSLDKPFLGEEAFVE